MIVSPKIQLKESITSYCHFDPNASYCHFDRRRSGEISIKMLSYSCLVVTGKNYFF
jgi:hypothetical protein